MSILGAVFAFVVVLLLGVPLCLLTFFSTPDSEILVFLGALAQRLLGGFLVVYVFAVLSSFLFLVFAETATVYAPTFRIRWAWIWILSLFYLVGTVVYLIIGAPALLSLYLYVSTEAAGSNVAGSLALIWLLLLFSIPGHFIAVLIAYIVASVFSPRHDQYVYNDSEFFVRGLLIGLNAGMNFLLGATAIGAVLAPLLGRIGAYVGLAAGIILAVVNLLAAGMPTGSQDANDAIKRIVGWMSWLMPTNWIVIFLGWILYVISALFSVLLGWTPFYGLYLINAALIEWPYGSMFIEGGIGSNLWLQGPIDKRGGYNLGLFSFIHADTIPEVEPVTGLRIAVGLGTDQIFDKNTRKHESGHNLNLTAFGAYFHLIGAVDENVGPFARGRNAYSERLADSNVPGPTGSSPAFNPTTNPNPQTPLPFWTF